MGEWVRLNRYMEASLGAADEGRRIDPAQQPRQHGGQGAVDGRAPRY